jgi:plasmid rolling circle replication initiator protein Rep
MVQVIENVVKGQNKAENAPPLDTLAQLGTNSLKKKATSKWFTQKLTKELLEIGSPLSKQYKRAYYCNQTLIQHDRNKITAKYCNSRSCNICNRIRTAKMMNGYILPLKELGDLQFVTLTEPNVKESELEETIRNQIKKISNIFEVFRKRRGISISGIRKLECTYNDKRNDYHPHIHLLINKNVAPEFINEWLKRNPSAKLVGQNYKDADQNSLNELFKYTTKQYEIEKEDKTLEINVRSLDVILRAYNNKRTFQTFGEIRKIKVIEEVEELESQEYTDLPNYHYMEWEWNIKDWYNIYEEPLSNNIEPSVEIKARNKTYMQWTEKEKIIRQKEIDRNNKKNKEQLIPKYITGRLKNIVDERM